MKTAVGRVNVGVVLMLIAATPHAAATLEPDFTWDLENPSTADFISFTSATNSTRPIINCDWSAVVEGVVRTLRSECEPQHRFTRPGTYDITLTVTNDLGESNKTTKRLFIANQPPVAHATFEPPSPTTDDEVVFVDASTDVDGFIEDHEWQAQGVEGLQSTFRHRFTEPGMHQVNHTVYDDFGGSNTLSLMIYVRPGVGPAADFVVQPQVPEPGQVVTFTDVSRTLAGDRVVEWNWRFADGVISKDPTVLRTFAQEGTYRVVLAVLTEKGETLTISRDIYVDEPAPVLAAAAEPPLFELVAPLALLAGVALLMAMLGWRNRGPPRP